LIALHDAGYREVALRLPAGRVLDVGCGVGSETAALRSSDRVLFGVDYDAETARIAAGTGMMPACADGASLPFADGSFDAVCSSHLIEHFVDPEEHVAEISRVLAPNGRAVFVTPNEPADFENPFHVSLFTAESLRSTLGRHFDRVSVVGLDGDELVKEDFERRRRTGRRLLALDPFGLRHRLPRSWYVGLHALGRRLVYPLTNRRESKEVPVSADHFSIVDMIDDSTLVLLATAEGPRNARSA
jgi:SAM-dependent methyltransferase